MTNNQFNQPIYNKLSEKEQLKLMENLFLQSNTINFMMPMSEWEFKAVLGIKLSRLQDKLGVPNIVTNAANRQKALDNLNKVEINKETSNLKEDSNTSNMDILYSIAKILFLIIASIVLIVVGYIKIKTYKEQQKVREAVSQA